MQCMDRIGLGNSQRTDWGENGGCRLEASTKLQGYLFLAERAETNGMISIHVINITKDSASDLKKPFKILSARFLGSKPKALSKN